MTGIRMDLPDELHMRLKLRATEKSMFLKTFIIKTLEKEVETDGTRI
jgi:predicted HicB family RNase H-like nuclease